MFGNHEYRYKNLKGGNCLIYCYFDGVLWCRYRVKGHFIGGNIEEFLDEKLLSTNVYSISYYLENMDEYLLKRSKYELKGGI